MLMDFEIGITRDAGRSLILSLIDLHRSHSNNVVVISSGWSTDLLLRMWRFWKIHKDTLTFYIKVRKAPRERSLSLKAELAKAGNPVSIEVMFAGKSRLLRKMYFALDSESSSTASMQYTRSKSSSHDFTSSAALLAFFALPGH